MSRPASQRSFADVAHLSSYSQCIPAIAQMLVAECEKNVAVERTLRAVGFAEEDAWQQIFHSTTLSQLHVKDLLIRMCKYMRCSPAIFVITAIYLDRFCNATSIVVTQANVHLLTLTAAVLAVKYHDDTLYCNTHYAGVAGVSLEAINGMEHVFLTTLEWACFVDYETFSKYSKQLGQPLARPPQAITPVSRGVAPEGFAPQPPCYPRRPATLEGGLGLAPRRPVSRLKERGARIRRVPSLGSSMSSVFPKLSALGCGGSDVSTPVCDSSASALVFLDEIQVPLPPQRQYFRSG